MVCRFPEAIEEMLQDMAPNRLTDYVFQLSQKFSSFYRSCKVWCKAQALLYKQRSLG